MAMLLGELGYARMYDVEDEIARLRQELQDQSDRGDGRARTYDGLNARMDSFERELPRFP